MFPKVPDQHKPNKPLVPNGLGVFYVLFSATYLFLVYFFDMVKTADGVSAPLTLAACVLFGGFMGVLDDWIDIKWRYKAFLPIIAAIPLVSLASKLELRTSISLLGFITIHFGPYYYFLVIPLLVTVITNTINQLGGLNGLETICPAIVMIGLMIASGPQSILLYGPLAVLLVLALLNYQGKIFVGNTGSFAIGMTLAAFSVISDLKFNLLVSIIPYILNSSLILLIFILYRKKANVTFDGKKLSSEHARSLVTLITYRRRLTERQVVAVVATLIAISTSMALVIYWLTL